LGVDAVAELNTVATGGLVPDLTFVLLVDPELGRGRLTGRPDRIEREDAEFVRRVDAGYRALAAPSSGRHVALDGSLSAEELARRVQISVYRLIPACRDSTAAPSSTRPSGCSTRRSTRGRRTRISSTARTAWASARSPGRSRAS